MNVESLVVGAFEENSWLLHDPVGGEAVLVDPGDEPERVCAMVERANARLTAIWLTHAHLDHIGAVAGVRRAWPGVPVYLHPDDRPIYDRGAVVARTYGLPFEQPGPPERTLAEGDRLTVGPHVFEVWHLPGHAPGHVAFVGAERVFSGDLLFEGSIGRSDLPLSDPAALEQSLRRLITLPPATLVHPGHGQPTTIATEMASNPFLNGIARIPRR